MRYFKDKIIIITGGASGIGEALGREAARRKAVVIIADRNIIGAQSAASAIRTSGGKAHVPDILVAVPALSAADTRNVE